MSSLIVFGVSHDIYLGKCLTKELELSISSLKFDKQFNGAV
jgi:hypothetical protein